MINLSQDIYSLTDFKRRIANYMKRLKASHRPMILTVNGRAGLVIQDPDSYQRLVEMAERFEVVSALQEGIAQADRGEGMSLDKFDELMRKKHGLPH